MGEQAKEDQAKDDFERVKTENLLKHQESGAAVKKYREEREAAEAAAKQTKMSVEQPPASGETWSPAAQEDSPGLRSTVAGKLAIGSAGDAEFAKRLLDSGQPRAGSTTAEQSGASDGAKSKVAGALGVRSTRPAFER